MFLLLMHFTGLINVIVNVFFLVFFYKEGPMKALTLSILGLHLLKILLEMISEWYLDFTKIVWSFKGTKQNLEIIRRDVDNKNWFCYDVSCMTVW